jgi:hypothetical protein
MPDSLGAFKIAGAGKRFSLSPGERVGVRASKPTN